MIEHMLSPDERYEHGKPASSFPPNQIVYSLTAVEELRKSLIMKANGGIGDYVLDILKHTGKGYVYSAWSWNCPLCPYQIYPDSLMEYVERTSIEHTVTKHGIDRDRIRMSIRSV